VTIDHGAILEFVLAALGGFCEINGMRPPDVLRTSSCLQQLLKLVCVSVAWTACAGGARGLGRRTACLPENRPTENRSLVIRPPYKKKTARPPENRPIEQPPAKKPPALLNTARSLVNRPPSNKPASRPDNQLPSAPTVLQYTKPISIATLAASSQFHPTYRAFLQGLTGVVVAKPGHGDAASSEGEPTGPLTRVAHALGPGMQSPNAKCTWRIFLFWFNTIR
jgi:hypothetical protein